MPLSWVKNIETLSSSKPRADALRILEAGYDAINTERIVQTHISVTDESITVRGHTFDIRPFKNIYLMGFGKGSCVAINELYNLLKTRVKKSVVIDRAVLTTCPVEIEAFAGTHPLPSETNVKATQVLMGVAEEAGEDDLVLVVVAGGGSALLCSSIEECDQSTRLFEEFERVGAPIEEVNLVRKHISSLKGGGLAEVLHPATVVGLVFSDIVGGNPEEVASGPTYYDASTIDDARAVLQRYGLESKFVLQETPKDRSHFEKVTNIVLISNEDALEAMGNVAHSIGYKSVIVPKPLYEFTQEALQEIFSRGAPGTVVLAGGEVRFKVPEDHGQGGRCQFFALEALHMLGPRDIFVAAASDGRDNSEKAGAIVDQGTVERIAEQKINLEHHRARADTIPAFEKTGDEILTGPTEANVSDWYFLLTPIDAP